MPVQTRNASIKRRLEQTHGITDTDAMLEAPKRERQHLKKKTRREAAGSGAVEEPRRSGRPRRQVDYAEPSWAQLEAAAAAAAAPTADAAGAEASQAEPLRAAYAPPAACTSPVHPTYDASEGRRDRQGRLAFAGHPEFRPNLTPKQVIQAGSFGGIYFNPRGGKPGILGKEVAVDHSEFPADWFEGLPRKAYRGRVYTVGTNKYGVKAGQDQKFWEEKGWIDPQDPRGWFQWYCRFYTGRRTADDARQIRRWRGVVGDKGRWVRALVNKIVRSNKRWDDASVSPVIRQTLLHWAFELTEAEFQRMHRQL